MLTRLWELLRRGRERKEDAALPPDTERLRLLAGVRAAFESHGVAAEDIAGTNSIAAGGLAIGIEIFNETRTATGWTSQIDVRVVLPDGRRLIDP